jgi:2-polyprenyl-3-methyl-5-hydroxy-6-metoxy-1,4-benzoquinol methylase
MLSTRLVVICATWLAVAGASHQRAGSPQSAPPTAAPASQAQTPAARARDFWNKEFSEGKVLLHKGPSALLVTAVKGRKPGTALDIGMGQGRNAVYLAELGWTITGVDLSDVAIEQAKANASAKSVKLNAVVSDLDTFDFGKEQWDLITSFYMHAWHRRSPTDVPARIFDALKPGGLLVIEGFAEPPNKAGFQTEMLAEQFSRMRILRNETIEEYPAWYVPERVPLVFFVAEKQK